MSSCHLSIFLKSYFPSPFKVILAIRTWAVWQRDWRIGCGLIILVAGCFTPTCIFTVYFLRSLECTLPYCSWLSLFNFASPVDPPLYVGFRGCIGQVKRGGDAFVSVFAIGIIEIGELYDFIHSTSRFHQ